MEAVRLIEQFRINSNLVQQGADTLVAINMADVARHDRRFADEAVRMVSERYPECTVEELYTEMVNA